jgi:hypothetical protein
MPCEKADRTNSTFDFFANTQAKPEKPKELFFANARQKKKKI